MQLLAEILQSGGPQESTDLFSDAVPVDIENVAQWLDATYPDGTRLEDHRFILNAPFDWFWMEYSRGVQRYGFMFRAPDAEDTNHLLAFGFHNNPAKQMGALLIQIDNDGGSPVCQYVLDSVKEVPEEGEPEAAMHALIPCLFAITFFHCRNVTIQESPLLLSRADRRRLERAGVVAPPTVRRILVHAGKRLLYEIPGNSDGGRRRSHVVRGHFKHFGDKFGTSRLFGRIDGTYFWSPHMAGVGAPANRAEYKVLEPKDGDNH